MENNNEEIELYTKKIFDNFMIWQKHLKVNNRLTMGPIAFNNHIKKIVTKIVNNNNQYLLTDEIIRYIISCTFGSRIPDQILLSQLGNFINIDEKGIRFLYDKYLMYLIHSDTNIRFRYNIDNIDEYYKLMDEDKKFIIQKTKEIDLELRSLPLNKNVYKIFNGLLFKYATYCVINKDRALFEKIVNHFFTDVPRVVERLFLNGIIKKKGRETDNFDLFVNVCIDGVTRDVIKK